MTKTLKNSSSLTISQQSENFQSDSTVKTQKIYDGQLLKKIVDIIEKMFIRKKNKRNDPQKIKKKTQQKDEHVQQEKGGNQANFNGEALSRQKNTAKLEALITMTDSDHQKHVETAPVSINRLETSAVHQNLCRQKVGDCPRSKSYLDIIEYLEEDLKIKEEL